MLINASEHSELLHVALLPHCQGLFILRRPLGCSSTPVLYHRSFSFFLLLILYWGIAGQQCCDIMVSGKQKKNSTIHSPPNPSSQPAFHINWVEFHVLCYRSLLVVHFKYSSVYMSIPNSISILSSPSWQCGWTWKLSSLVK